MRISDWSSDVCSSDLSDVAAARAGDRARLMLTAGAAIVAGAGATLFAAGSAPLALAGTGTWMFASAAGAVSGIAALQALAPPPVRGLAMSMIAFCNTLLGLGLGPRSEEHTSELPSLMRISYSVFFFKKTNKTLIKNKQ